MHFASFKMMFKVMVNEDIIVVGITNETLGYFVRDSHISVVSCKLFIVNSQVRRRTIRTFLLFCFEL